MQVDSSPSDHLDVLIYRKDDNRRINKASGIPADPRTAVPDRLRTTRIRKFDGLPLLREIGQYIGNPDWFKNERNLVCLLAYMTGDICKPCNNCQTAARKDNQSGCKYLRKSISGPQLLTVAATLTCITSPYLTYGEYCHCHFRGSHSP